MLFLTMPTLSGGMGSDGPVQVVAPLAALLVVGIGWVWMWRILRADPEPDTAAWRYRDD